MSLEVKGEKSKNSDGRKKTNTEHTASATEKLISDSEFSRLFNEVIESKKRMPKQRRTRNHNRSPSPGQGFFVPEYADRKKDAGHKSLTPKELKDAANGVTNMYLAHEIAVDKDFRLENIKGEEGQEEHLTLEANIKKIVHQAFWDVLDAELKEEPPIFNQALSLMEQLRSGLCKMLLPSQHRIKTNIMERLDIDLIKQQAENGVLDFDSYAVYVLDLMGKLCAPVRDDEINALKEIDRKNVVKLFRGIMKALDNMRLDMANFMIQQARPLIMSQSVEYEKIKFKEFLETQKDGLEFTRAWLMRHAPPPDALISSNNISMLEDVRFKKKIMNWILTEALVGLLGWDDSHKFPETLAMDQKRIFALRDQTERTSVAAAVILVTFSNINSLIIPMDSQKLKEKIKAHVDVLLQDFYNDNDLLKILPNVALQVIKGKSEDSQIVVCRNPLGCAGISIKSIY